MKKWKIVIIFFLMIALILQLSSCEFAGQSPDGTANVSPLVEQWRSDVERYAEKYGVSEYVELILAMIAQESGGDSSKYPDIMQSSESAGLPRNSISDPQASLDQGIKYFASLVQKGKDEGVDMDTVIQSYNFGSGYLTYIRDHYNSKHSEEAARAFSAKMAAKMGWSSYGDVKYLEHVNSHMAFRASGEAIDNYDTMYALMKEYEGVPYVFGGTSKSGIDCSAMTQKLYQAVGFSLPRTAQEQYESVSPISESEVKPGDLVFFTKTYSTSKYITHVGVYVGNNTMFHAGGNQCHFTSLNTSYYQSHFVGFGRK